MRVIIEWSNGGRSVFRRDHERYTRRRAAAGVERERSAARDARALVAHAHAAPLAQPAAERGLGVRAAAALGAPPRLLHVELGDRSRPYRSRRCTLHILVLHSRIVLCCSVSSFTPFNAQRV